MVHINIFIWDLYCTKKSHGIYQSHEIEGHNKERPFRENIFWHVPLFPLLIQKPRLLHKPFIWKKCQILQDLSLVRVVGYEIACNTVSQLLVSGHSPILSEWWSIWDGELDTLLLGWEEVWLPGWWFSSREGAGEGLSGIRSWYKMKHKIIQFTYALKLS